MRENLLSERLYYSCLGSLDPYLLLSRQLIVETHHETPVLRVIGKNPLCSFKFFREMGGKGRGVAKLVARLLATAALCVRIQISLKNTKWVA
jgi:hypothetical protein